MDIFAPIAAKLALWWANTPTHKAVSIIGIAGQLMFSLRWLQQWLASEREGTPTVPAAFWYYSLLGGLMVLSYGIYFMDPVVILAQFGVFVYARNVYLLHAGPKAKRAAESAAKVEPKSLRQKKT
ncbi:MAG: lipid-A-disaccharide synthase N-terminal domain-containing protein [Hyphomicrobiaceae bacterium]